MIREYPELQTALKEAGALTTCEELLNCSKGGLKKAGNMPKFRVPKQFTDKIPVKWKKIPSNNMKGIKYANPKNPKYDYIRFMDRNPSSLAPPGQRVPYFIRIKDGNKYLTKEGKWVLKKFVKRENIHIPQDMFQKLLPYMDFN